MRPARDGRRRPRSRSARDRRSCSSTSVARPSRRGSSRRSCRPCATMTPLAPPSGTTTSAVIACDLFLKLRIDASVSRPMPPNSSWRLPFTVCGRPAMSALARSANRSSSGSTLYLTASISHSRWRARSFSGVLGSEVVRLRPVGGGVVQLPHVVVERRERDDAGLPRGAVLGDGGPALVEDAAVAHHLEVLRLVPFGRVGVVERVRHAHAFDRPLLHAVHEHRLGQTRPPRAASVRCR